MNIWAALVIIAVVFAVVSLMRGRREADPAGDGHGPSADDQQRENERIRELEALRERVQVLERIATEDGEARRLAAEIERLRDEDPADRRDDADRLRRTEHPNAPAPRNDEV